MAIAYQLIRPEVDEHFLGRAGFELATSGSLETTALGGGPRLGHNAGSLALTRVNRLQTVVIDKGHAGTWLTKCPVNWHYSSGLVARIAPRRSGVRVPLAPSTESLQTRLLLCFLPVAAVLRLAAVG